MYLSTLRSDRWWKHLLPDTLLSPACVSTKRNKDRCHWRLSPEILSAERECEVEIVYCEAVCTHAEFTETWQRSDTPLSSCLFDRPKVTGTLRQMVFISLSAACLQGNLGWRSPVSSDRLELSGTAAGWDGIFPPIEVKGHRREWVALRLKTKQELAAHMLWVSSIFFFHTH